MLPYNWYMAIPEAERPALADSPLQILAGNQSKFNVLGVARFDICIKDMAYPCLMHVSPDETSGVLGMDFMTHHNVVVDPGKQALSINGKPMEVLDFSGKKISSRVTATRTVHLQPKERYVVPAHIAGRQDLEERTVVIEGARSLVLRHGAMAARVIARARNGNVPMEVRNVTDQVITIHKGTVLGVAFQALEMKPWVDPTTGENDTDEAPGKPTEMSEPPASSAGKQDMSAEQTAPSVGKQAENTGQPTASAGEPATSVGQTEASTGNQGEPATVHRIHVAEKPIGPVPPDGLPEHVQELYMKHRDDMAIDDQQLYKNLLMSYSEIFAKHKTDLGHTDLIKHHIETGDEQPFKHKPRRLPQAKFDEMKRQVEALAAQGVIRPSTSNWGSNVLLVKKKDGSWRMCIDYRELNAKTKNIDPYVLPRVDDTLDALSGAKFFCTLDLIAGYHQLELTESSKYKTAFITPRMNPSQWEYNMLPFGVLGGPATFQRAIDLLLLGLEYKIALAYLDDIIVFGSSHKQCIERLAEVFERLKAANLKLKPSKCVLFAPETLFLGHVISAEGVKCDPKKVEAVRTWEAPRTARQVQQFLGTVNYYNRFIKNYSEIAKPLYAASNRKKKFEWTEECEQAFQTLRTALTTDPVMAYPNSTGLMVLDTDASAFAIGGVLSQMQPVQKEDGTFEEAERVIAYASRTLEGREQRYCTRRRELLAIVTFVKHFRAYLYGRECLIRTDHASLKYIKTLRDPDDQFARWIERLEETKYTIEVRAGKAHANADALSRLPSSTCAGKRCICQGVHELESTGDYQDDYITQAQIDAGNVPPVSAGNQQVRHVRHNTAVLRDAGDNMSSDEESEIVAGTSNSLPAETSEQPTDAAVQQDDPAMDPMAFTDAWTADELAKAQQADSEIAPIYRAKLADTKRPLEAVVSGYSEATKSYLHDWDRLHIRADGVLYRRFESHDGTDGWQQILLPQQHRLEACRRFHDVSVAAHMGRRKTTTKMQRRFHWHRMAEDIRWWIATCDLCQKRKCPKAWPRAPMQLFLAGEPNERVAMDIIDHLQISNSGSCCVLCITDHFSKYVKAIPLPNQTAETVADAFLRCWVAVFGAPHMLHTDQGRNFDSAVIAEMCILLDIYKTRTSAYHPAGNGHTERFNRCIMDMIHAQVRKNPADWDRALPWACMAYNSTPHTSTGFEPNRLMFGRNTYMPADRMMPADPERPRKTITQFARELDAALREAHQIARERINRAATVQKKHYDRKSHLNHYKVGDPVQLKVFRREKGVGKFADRYEGPYYVLDVLSDVNFRIIRAMEDKPKVVHHDHLIPYKERVPEPEADKAWIFQRSRTYKAPAGDAEAQTDARVTQDTCVDTADLPMVTDQAIDPQNDVASTSAATLPTDVAGDCDVQNVSSTDNYSTHDCEMVPQAAIDVVYDRRLL